MPTTQADLSLDDIHAELEELEATLDLTMTDHDDGDVAWFVTIAYKTIQA
jgi:hypothetical protein